MTWLMKWSSIVKSKLITLKRTKTCSQSTPVRMGWAWQTNLHQLWTRLIHFMIRTREVWRMRSGGRVLLSFKICLSSRRTRCSSTHRTNLNRSDLTLRSSSRMRSMMMSACRLTIQSRAPTSTRWRFRRRSWRKASTCWFLKAPGIQINRSMQNIAQSILVHRLPRRISKACHRTSTSARTSFFQIFLSTVSEPKAWVYSRRSSMMRTIPTWSIKMTSVSSS